jgi:AcrR family transcriptional regulator/DNA-binding MarR family transcriptional regulator
MAVEPRSGSARVAPRGSGKVAGRRRGVNESKSPAARGQVDEMQRARLLGAAVRVVDELGWSSVTVADIASRARVSRRTFYDLFANREECLLAVLDDTVRQLERDLAQAGLEDDASWADRVRAGLFTILSFFDREPNLARLCVVQALRGGPRVLVWREDILARLAGIIDQGRGESARGEDCTVLTAEGLVGAASTIVYSRLHASKRREPLVSLLGELMSMIVLPYRGPAAARAERREIGTFSSGRESPAGVKSPTRSADLSGGDPLAAVPMRLTYRTARVLQAAAENPGASNRQVGERADIYDQGQISKLLARLERLGLLVNTGEGHAKGEANAWRLTSLGEQVTEQLHLSSNPRGQRA